MMYDPGKDAADRFPDWVIRHRQLPARIPEVLCRRRRTILINNHGSWPEKRCSLAHAVAHLDLGHTSSPLGFFDRRMEAEANDLAARRLLPREALAATLCWTRYREEIAEELQVDVPMLAVREQNMRIGERAWIRKNVLWLEETA